MLQCFFNFLIRSSLVFEDKIKISMFSWMSFEDLAISIAVSFKLKKRKYQLFLNNNAAIVAPIL